MIRITISITMSMVLLCLMCAMRPAVQINARKEKNTHNPHDLTVNWLAVAASVGNTSGLCHWRTKHNMRLQNTTQQPSGEFKLIWTSCTAPHHIFLTASSHSIGVAMCAHADSIKTAPAACRETHFRCALGHRRAHSSNLWWKNKVNRKNRTIAAHRRHRLIIMGLEHD